MQTILFKTFIVLLGVSVLLYFLFNMNNNDDNFPNIDAMT